MTTETINMPDLSFLDQPGIGFEERGPREPLPAGWYTATITEFRDSKGGTYPRDEEGKNQRTIVMAVKVTEGERASDSPIFIRANYRPELLTAEYAQRVSELQKSDSLWTNGTTDEKSAFFTQRLIGSLRKAASAQGRTFAPNGHGFNTDAITNLPVRVNLQVEPAIEQYPAKNKLNGFAPFDAVK